MGAAWLLALATVWAQDIPLPAPLSALALDDSTPCPDVPAESVPRLITTSVGPARHAGDGTYAWICPSLWGGALNPVIASDPTGGTLAVVADDRVFTSTDGGCSFAGVPLPRGTLTAIDTFYWRDGFWVVATDESATSTVIYLLQDGGLTEFATLEGIVASDASPSGIGALWVVGLRPQATVYRVNLVGGVSGTDTPLPDLPSADRVTGLSIAGSDDDEAWIRVDRGLDKSFWFGRHLETGITLWDAPEGSWRSMHGPVLYDGLWLASLDGDLYTAGQVTGNLVEVGSSAVWTALQVVGKRLFAGSPTELLAVTGFDDDLTPRTTPAFTLAQLSRPAAACQIDGCDALLDQIATVATIDPDLPASCPDGRTLADLQPETCACDGSGTGGLGALALTGLIAGRRRRERSS